MLRNPKSAKSPPRGLEFEVGRPKHRAIADWILSEVESGRWLPGDQIPSEEQLVAETETSLGTVQRALRNLVDMGVLLRHHGRGTFVAGARAPTNHLRHFRFLAEDGQSLLPIYVNVVDIALVDETGPWSAFLGESEEGYVRLRRLVSVAREFSLFSEIYLSADRFAALTTMEHADLDGVSIRDALAERFNAPTLTVDQTLLCQPLPPRVTKLIDVPAGTFGIVWTIGGRSYRDAPITWQRVFVPPNDRPLDLVSRSPREGSTGGA